jgi:hypothetical protein
MISIKRKRIFSGANQNSTTLTVSGERRSPARPITLPKLKCLEEIECDPTEEPSLVQGGEEK